MIKGQARAVQWRAFSILAALVWTMLLLTQLAHQGLAFAIIASILPGIVVALTGLIAFGYQFQKAQTQRRLCVFGMMLCLRRLVPAIGGATFFFQANMVRNHWTATQAMGVRIGLIATAVVLGAEFWALSVFSRPVAVDPDLGSVFA